MTAYIVSSGQTLSGITLGAGDTMDVFAGGTAVNTTVLSGGNVTVRSGGSEIDTTDSGGTDTVGAGGTATGTLVLGASSSGGSGGTEFVEGTASGTTVQAGGTVDVFTTGKIVSATLNSGGNMNIASGALGSGIDVIAGTFNVQGDAFGVALKGDLAGVETVSSGGTTTSTTLSSGGELDLSGGTASITTILASGSAVVFAGGTATGTTISSGGLEQVFTGGTDSGAVISSGGTQSVGLGGTASGATVSAAGSQNVFGSAFSTIVESGGTQNVFGTASGTIVDSSGTEDVQPGGIDSGTIVGSGGNQFVIGSSVNATVSAGAMQSVLGSTLDTTVAAGGTELVFGGGVAGNTLVSGSGAFEEDLGSAAGITVSAGGSALIAGGAVASGITIATGGIVDINLSTAIVSGPVDFVGSGGTYEIDFLPPPADPIAGFTQSGDTVDLTQMLFSDNTSVGFDSGTDILTVVEGGTSATLQLDSENYAGITWSASQDNIGIGTDVTAFPCFCRGTLILTETGEVAVEELAIGDRVVTVSGAARPIKWIGRRAYDGRFIAANRAALPICIEAGARGEGVPARDLFVSPEHALYLDGVLVPAGLLTNGATIRQAESVERLDYFHIELETHDVLLAEGMPAETYVDCDNRLMFQNGAEFAGRYPDDRPVPWSFCAPRVGAGSAELLAVRKALAERVEALGYALSEDPGLHLIADGEIIRAQSVAAEVHHFTLPAGTRALAIASRSVVPAEVEPASPDRRRLGVAVGRIVLRADDLRIEIGSGHAALRDGFHADEGAHRWTDGLARLPQELLRPFGGAATLELHLSKSGLRYPTAATGAAAAIRVSAAYGRSRSLARKRRSGVRSRGADG